MAHLKKIRLPNGVKKIVKKLSREASQDVIRPLERSAEVPLDYQWARAKPYEEIPGPRPAPLLGNTWRFLPYIGEPIQMKLFISFISFHCFNSI